MEFIEKSVGIIPRRIKDKGDADFGRRFFGTGQDPAPPKFHDRPLKSGNPPAFFPISDQGIPHKPQNPDYAAFPGTIGADPDIQVLEGKPCLRDFKVFEGFQMNF